MISLPATKSGYFPAGIFGITHEHAAEHFSSYLTAMGEPVLYSAQLCESRVYRFLFLPTWHQPLSVRLAMTPTSDVVTTATVLSGTGGYGAGHVTHREVRTQEGRVWVRWNQWLADCDFWNQPATINDQGLDGATWLLEGIAGNTYHVLKRWSPPQSASRAACEWLAVIAGFEGSALPG